MQLGVSRINSGEYLVSTLDGHIKNIKIQFNTINNKTSIQIASNDIKSPINSNLYALYGLATSLQNGFVILPIFANAVIINEFIV